ncbi:MAG: hypothetical protein JWR67_984 [Mucilaginibacter sp.]|nr:hypothetical protein [Mucilaginibacter sp.]
MKKIIRILMLLTVTSLFTIANGNAQIIVRVRPRRPGPVIVRTPPPSPRHVWVEEEWVSNGRAYAYRPGHWVLSPHPGAAWVPGHWANRRGGSIWISGHWR